MAEDLYDVGSGLAVPGLEATLEYGDAETAVRDRLPGAVLINDRSMMECVRIGQIDGLHGDPDGRDTRDSKADQDGEDAGLMRYGGRTIGLTGQVEAGSITALRDVWSRFSSQFGKRERDLIVHPHSEVALIENLIENPSMAADIDGWDASDSLGQFLADARPSGDFGVSGGTTFNVTYSTIDGQLWDGRDVFVAVLLRPQSTTSSITSIGISLQARNASGNTVGLTVPIDTESSPSLLNWYLLKGRLLAADINPATRRFDVILTGVGTTGNHLVRWAHTTMIMVDVDAPSPDTVFDASHPGFEWTSMAGRSTSIGPVCSQNLVHDPQLTQVVPSASVSVTSLTYWDAVATGSTTVNRAPVATPKWAGDSVPRSAYFKLTKDATSTARDMGIISTPSLTDEIQPGTTYRFQAMVNVLQKPSGDALKLGIKWVMDAGTTYSLGDALAVGIASATVTGTAPDGVISATVGLFCLAATTSAGVLEAYLSDPCWVATTFYDPGEFFGSDGCADVQIVVDGGGAVRRTPRPWLLRRVRKTSDAKAPEQQQSYKVTRDFTMSLRAADPRIYVMDQRRRQIELVGDSKFVARQPPADFTLETSSLPVPTDFTYEGGNRTAGTSGGFLKWTQENTALGYGTGAVHALNPLGGVGIRAWDSAGLFPGNDPASDIVARAYRSGEGFTYGDPRVVLGGAPSSFGSYASSPPADLRGMAVQYSGTAGSRTFKKNYLAALLKRVDSTHWLELRWNSWEHDFPIFDGVDETLEPNAPYAFELWSSHNSSGTLSTTLLQGWDYLSKEPNGLYPFRPSVDPMWLVSWMSDDVVYWELWSSYPSPVDLSGRIESGSHALSASLLALVGSAHSGSTGWSMQVASGTTGDGVFPTIGSVPPFMHYFESSDTDVPSVSQTIPVIGSIETPQVIELRGDLVDPIVQVSVPEFDQLPRRTSTARFSGTIEDANPIYVDLYDGSVRDQFGLNRRDLLVPGSDFEMIRPGFNQVSLQAKSWGEYPAHLITSWRDALR